MKQLWERIVSLAGSNFGLKALALIIAVGLWLAGHRDIERAIEVPVEFRNMPADLAVMDNRVEFIVLRLTGPRTLVSTIDADEMKLFLDLNGAKSGPASFPLGASSFNIPRGVTVARISPPVIHIRLEPVVKRTLPVTVRFSGKPAAGLRVAHTVVQPENVLVQGPAEDVRRLAAVETVPVDLGASRGVSTRKVRLSTDGKPFSFTPDQVEVSITLEEEEASRDFQQVEVRAKDFKGAYSVTPKSVFLRLTGPKQIIEKLQLNSDAVYLDLKGLPAGDHNVSLVVNLPAGVNVVEQKPSTLRVRIIKPAG
jgi:YbbR domain-containing protein